MTNGNEPISPLMPSHTNPASIIETKYSGLTKREYFSAMAMQGLLASNTYLVDEQRLCQSAVKYADTLINELNKKA